MTDKELMQQALDALEAHADFGIKAAKQIEALRARLAQPEPEPAAWMYDSHVGFNVPLYTAPPQREWQGLTDEEIENCFEMSMFGTCRAIEAKLKEKNA